MLDYDRKRHEQFVRAGVRTVENAEDYRDYQADKGLYEARKLREKMGDMSYMALVRKWADANNA